MGDVTVRVRPNRMFISVSSIKDEILNAFSIVFETSIPKRVTALSNSFVVEARKT